MKFKAEIDVMPLKSLLDPQGKAVSASMGNVGLSEIKNVRQGKLIEINLDTKDFDEAKEQVKKMSEQLLTNPIIEDFTIELE